MVIWIDGTSGTMNFLDMKNKRILLTGGSGLLGKELLKINPDIEAPGKGALDICDESNVFAFLYWNNNNYNTVIHCAALLDQNTIEKDPHKVIQTNIIGTANIAMWCSRLKLRLVYISTDYVYPGKSGDYNESDPVQPFNFYAWTKLGGEAAVRGVKDHLIIRTSFSGSECKYPVAYDNLWRSREYVDKLAPDIYEAAISDLQGVLNLGGPRRTPFDYARERNPDIKSSSEYSGLPYDTSLDLTKWKNYKNGRNS